LPVVAPAYRSAVESIVASSNVRLSEQGHVPGFAENRLIETIRASGLGVECSKLLEKAVHRAAKRCSGIRFRKWLLGDQIERTAYNCCFSPRGERHRSVACTPSSKTLMTTG